MSSCKTQQMSAVASVRLSLTPLASLFCARAPVVWRMSLTSSLGRRCMVEGGSEIVCWQRVSEAESGRI